MGGSRFHPPHESSSAPKLGTSMIPVQSLVPHNSSSDPVQSPVLQYNSTDLVKITLRCFNPRYQATVQMQANKPIARAIAKFAKKLRLPAQSLESKVEEVKLSGEEKAEGLVGRIVTVIKRGASGEDSDSNQERGVKA